MVWSPWLHQAKGIVETYDAREAGFRKICVTSPTGGGKSQMIRQMIEDGRQQRLKSILYTNRKMLLEQISGVLTAAGIGHGLRASGHDPRLLDDVQVSSISTENSRVFGSGRWPLHEADQIFIDEAHGQKGAIARKLIDEHLARGATIYGFTATPLDIGDIYEKLVVAGVNSELRACGAHLPCYMFSPDEPDMRWIKAKSKSGEFTEGQARKAIMRPRIFARVLESFRELNAEGRPTILFAPGVRESVWFAEQFREAGISAAHIDGENISFGETEGEGDDKKSIVEPSTPQMRADILGGSEDGSIKVLCNRFVLREAIDAPWLGHCIFATIIGSIVGYLQSGGRLLRSHPSLDRVTVQDHGGHWWRPGLGSLNADRHWELNYSSKEYAAKAESDFREKREQEPIRCPKCGAIRRGGERCHECGFITTKKSRMVVQVDGTLKEMKGDIFKPQVVSTRDDTEKLWNKYYFSSKNSGQTFSQARGRFKHDQGYWPPTNLPLMPLREIDWASKIKDVPFSDLKPDPNYRPKEKKAEPIEQQRRFA